MAQDDTLLCPKCHSSQLYVGKRGFKVGRAAAAGILTGNAIYTMLAGGIGQNDIEIVCLKCGNKFKPGQAVTEKDLKPFVMPKGVTYVGHTEQRAYYWCSCGKHTSLPTDRPICPKCGRRLNDSHKPTQEQIENEFKKGKSGCFGVLIIPPLIALALAAIL